MHSRISRRVRRGLFAVAAVGPLALFGVLVHAQEGQKPPTAKEKYKNIKVLGDLPADKLGPLMHEYNNALGVRCDFCHVGREFDKDDKPMKQKAREMIQLTKDLNGKYKTLDKKATCAMCHHGKAEPETAAPAPEPPK